MEETIEIKPGDLGNINEALLKTKRVELLYKFIKEVIYMAIGSTLVIIVIGKGVENNDLKNELLLKEYNYKNQLILKDAEIGLAEFKLKVCEDQ